MRILNLLATSDGPVCVCELTEPLGLSQPTVSHHIKKLADAGLLTREQRGVWAYYSLDLEAVSQLRAVVELGIGGRHGLTSCVSRSASTTRRPPAGATAAAARRSSTATRRPGDILSLGCGNPTAVAELREGETVLDLGSGAGLDVILSAKRVGPTGIAWGLDMTEEMLALARENAAKASVANAHFLKGHIEDVPLPADSVDAVISNCVINLSTDKPAVFRELARVLKPGGRLGVSDIVAEDRLTPAERAERGNYVGCVAGALSKGEYERLLDEAGFENVSVEFLYEAGDGIHGATDQGDEAGGGRNAEAVAARRCSLGLLLVRAFAAH